MSLRIYLVLFLGVLNVFMVVSCARSWWRSDKVSDAVYASIGAVGVAWCFITVAGAVR